MNEGAGDGIIAAANILQGERYDAASGDDIITKKQVHIPAFDLGVEATYKEAMIEDDTDYHNMPELMSI